MVYCGKPSKGCGECRSRKIRCDQAKPACSQCTKAHRECPGYRDQLSLMFRDESQQVVRKAKNSASTTRRATKTSKRAVTVRAISTPSPTPSEKKASGGEVQLQRTPSVTVDVLTPSDSGGSSGSGSNDSSPVQQINRKAIHIQPSYQPTQDEAVCYFLRYNAWPGAFWMLNATPDAFLQNNKSSSLQAMKAGVVSVGTAMLARIRRCPSLKLAAENEYGNALRLMGAAVTDVNEARANPTLAAVLLLAMFEVSFAFIFFFFL